MKIKNTVVIFILSIFLASCNYKLFVNKRYVVQDQKGYLVFREDEIIFFPFKDTIDVNFLADKKKKEGYKVDYDTDWLDSLSTDYTHLRIAKNATKFSIIPVKIRNYLGEMWRPISDKNDLSYIWNSKIYTLQYETADWRQILMISVARESDRKRIKDLHMPVDTINTVPHHWRPVK